MIKAFEPAAANCPRPIQRSTRITDCGTMVQRNGHRSDRLAKRAVRANSLEAATLPYVERYPWIVERADAPVSFEHFDTRSQTALLRARVRTWGDLGGHSDASIGAIPSVGTLTIRRINDVLEAAASWEQSFVPSERYRSASSPSTDELFEPLTASIEWASVVLDASTLGEVLDAARLSPEVPEEVSTELERLLGRELPDRSSMALAARLDELLSEARDPNLLVARELSPNPPTLEALAAERGLTRERIRQKVASDVERIRSLLATRKYRSVQWAIDRFQSDVGLIVDAESDIVKHWRLRCASTQFETLCWLAGYTYEEPWLLCGDDAIDRVMARLDTATDGEWLVRTDALAEFLVGTCHPSVGVRVLLESGRWRDIGDGWLVRWDGSLQAKAERVLRLTCTPMTPAELIRAIGHGSEGALKNQRGERLVRIDKLFRLALPEWGFEEYEGIVTEIRQRIERGGGVARVSDIIDEFTRSFGVSVSSVETYLNLPMFDVSGDSVRLGDDLTFVPKSPTTVRGAVEIGAGWGERHVVSEASYKGYSFGLNPHVCWANGLRPGDDLLAPLNGSSLRASVIWRTTNLSGTVDVGRVREWLIEHSAVIGSEVLICPTPTSVTLLVGAAQIEAAREAFEASAPAIAPDIATLMESL